MGDEPHIAAWVLGRLSSLVDAGGSVMWPLLAVGLLTWTLLVLRALSLHDPLSALRRWTDVGQAPGERGALQLALRLKRLELHRHATVIDTLVASAPLLGLLGTVSGMIATFEGLTTMSLYSEGGGVAGGISVALLTTQAGLMIAIPAFFASRVLARKVSKFDQRVEAALLARGAGPHQARAGGA